MIDTCGCCERIEQITPVTIYNRPGLNALLYRVGTHTTFFETMLARLSSLSIPLSELGPLLPPGSDGTQLVYPLQSLTTRDLSDPAIALLDAWSIVGDVFTFYQERLANEGYLRTATLRRSVLELARLVNYKLRPGVASSVYLAFTLSNGNDTLIPASTRAQNIPAAGQLPQSFETSVDLQTHAVWSNLLPRMSVPQNITRVNLQGNLLPDAIDTNVPDGSLYLDGIATGLKPHDPVLFVFDDSPGDQVFAHVQKVTPNAAAKYTNVTFPTNFTPLVLIRNLLDLIDRYLDLATFGVNPGDAGVDEIVPVLDLARVFLELVIAGSLPQSFFKDASKALSLIGRVLFSAEHLLDLFISNQSIAEIDDAIKNVIEELNVLNGEITGNLTDKSITTFSIVALLESVQAALEQFLQLFPQQIYQPDLVSLSQTAITMLQPFADLKTNADASKLAQDLQQALTSFSDPAGNHDFDTMFNVIKQKLQETTNPDLKRLAEALQQALTNQQTFITVLIVMQQVFNQFLTTQIADPDVTAFVQAVLSLLDQSLQTIRTTIDTLLQAINNALDNFSIGLVSLLPPNMPGIPRVNQLQAIGRGLSRTLAFASIKIPTIGDVLGLSSVFSRASVLFDELEGGRHFPSNPLTGTLLVWSDIHKSAATSGTINVANWSGGLINDAKSLLSSFPGVSQLLGTVPTAAVITGLGAQVTPLKQPLNIQPASSARLPRKIGTAFARSGDIAPQLLSTFLPQISSTLYAAYSSAQVTPPIQLENVYAQRVKAAPFGSNAPKQASTIQSFDFFKETFTTSYTEWPIAESAFVSIRVSPYDTSNPSRETVQLTFRQGRILESVNVGQDSLGKTIAIPYTQTVSLPSNNPVINITVNITVTTSKKLDTITITSNTGLSFKLTLDSNNRWNVDIDKTNVYPLEIEYDAQNNLNVSLAAPNPTTVLDLDARYDHIVPETWVVIESTSALQSHFPSKAVKIQSVETVARADYGIAAKVIRLTLYHPWLTTGDMKGNTLDLSLYRGINIYAQSEVLPLATVPVTDDVGGDTVELNDIYDGLQSGNYVIVTGERTDIHNTTGVIASELMTLQSVTQDATLPGDTVHTTLHFATGLVHTYKRSTVGIAGNVVAATQGETQNQILGSGDGSQSMQQFSLSKTPLTYVPAVTPTGEASTLQVRVNNILWHETDSLDGTQPSDRIYITQTDDEDKVTITFGNGINGARLPTGAENVKAVYRTGIGTSGNVDADKITSLVSRPLGVTGVNNPLPATGGADRETRDSARDNVPLASAALGRIVSVQDYAYFTRTFAGIGKASASNLSDGQQQVMYLTIAGQDNIPIDTTSSLYQSLVQSLQTFGDPSTPFILALADVKLMILSARVNIQADYLFDDVAAALRVALLDAFSFERRDLGQPIFASEVLSVMQQVTGVVYVDLDILDAINQQQLIKALQQIQADQLNAANGGSQATNPSTDNLVTLLGLKNRKVVRSALAHPDSKHAGEILPAELVFLSPDVPDTLILNQLTTLHFTPA